jgi:hypothetical protein
MSIMLTRVERRYNSSSDETLCIFLYVTGCSLLTFNDWLIDYVGEVRYISTVATNGPIFHPPGDRWAWRAMEIMVPTRENWLVHQSSLAVIPAETSGARRRNWRMSKNFAYHYLRHVKGFLTCRNILRYGISVFISNAKEGVLRILSPLKIHCIGRVWTCERWVPWQAH